MVSRRSIPPIEIWHAQHLAQVQASPSSTAAAPSPSFDVDAGALR
ncbi:hypothetical protein [Microbacterium sp. P02]